jgi:hypothetical protein
MFSTIQIKQQIKKNNDDDEKEMVRTAHLMHTTIHVAESNRIVRLVEQNVNELISDEDISKTLRLFCLKYTYLYVQKYTDCYIVRLRCDHRRRRQRPSLYLPFRLSGAWLFSVVASSSSVFNITVKTQVEEKRIVSYFSEQCFCILGIISCHVQARVQCFLRFSS